MSDQIQKFEAEITALKSRLFDAGESNAQAQQIIKNLTSGFQAIVETLGLTGDEKGIIEVQTVVDAVKALIPEQLELEGEAPETEAE